MREPIIRSHWNAHFPTSQGESASGSTPATDVLPDSADPGGRRAQAIYVAAFSATMFLSAALLFLVEPMFAKMALPLLGGSAAVWTTCIVFFQVTLLAGYAYAHASAKLLGKRAQVALHAVVLLAALALLPVHVPGGWTPPLQPNPVWVAVAAATRGGGLALFRVVRHHPHPARMVRAFRASLVGRPILSLRREQCRELVGFIELPLRA